MIAGVPHGPRELRQPSGKPSSRISAKWTSSKPLKHRCSIFPSAFELADFLDRSITQDGTIGQESQGSCFAPSEITAGKRLIDCPDVAAVDQLAGQGAAGEGIAE